MLEPFSFQKVNPNDKSLMEQIFRLRFQVYCHECGFIKKEDYPDGIETDAWDAQSVHFAALSARGDLMGTLRMILPGKLPLPIQTRCPDVFKKIDVSQNDYTEISRLVISKNVRRRQGDELYYAPEIEDKSVVMGEGIFFRRAKPMAFGIYRELYRESKRRGITRWFTIMEKSLYFLLRIHGFKFECIGPEIDFYGPVSPYVGRMDTIEQEVREKFEKFYQYFTENYKAEQEGQVSNEKILKNKFQTNLNKPNPKIQSLKSSNVL